MSEAERGKNCSLAWKDFPTLHPPNHPIPLRPPHNAIFFESMDYRGKCDALGKEGF